MRDLDPVSTTAARPSGHIRQVVRSWGSEIVADGEVRFTLWAPDCAAVELLLQGRAIPMADLGDGWKETVVPAVAPGTRYRFRLPDGRSVPDPASRRQSGGVDGESVVIDPAAYRWQDGGWTGRPWEEAVILELHIGTFTPEGTFAAAAQRLPHLAAMGFTVIEVMPVGAFAGDRGWGYDGVLPYAPHEAYGSVEDMKAFVEAAHALGLMVLLDVVYNHFGPLGNHLPAYASAFFEDRHTDWGQAFAFERRPVRDFFIDNALYWLIEFNLDGLRLDAVHAMEDFSSPTHVLVELAERVAAECTDRRRHLVVEDSHNLTRHLRRDDDGRPVLYTAAWNDDLHHSLHVAATGETGGHYANFAADPWRKIAKALTEGYVFQGEEARPDGKAVGEHSAHLPPSSFIDFLQNHDQIGNRPFGDRLNGHVEPARLRLFTALLLLSPHIPMLFMGEDYGETRPFRFFADFTGDLRAAVHAGRWNEAQNYAELPPEIDHISKLPDPSDPDTFSVSRLDWSRLDSDAGRAHAAWLAALIDKRRRLLVPLLGESRKAAARRLAAGDGSLALDWELDGGRLELRLNLTDAPVQLPPVTGSLVHAEPAGTAFPPDGSLPALSLVVACSPRDSD